MAAASWFRYTYRAYFSKPKSDRQLYRLVKQRRFCRIVEIGISDLGRSVSLVEVAQRYAVGRTVLFTGIDWFEARSQEMSPLTLKGAYRALHATGAKVRLAPGAPGVSLAAAANAHQNTDFILISASVADADLQSAWFYVPRMLHARSVVLREHRDASGVSAFAPISPQQIATWAAASTNRRAA